MDTNSCSISRKGTMLCRSPVVLMPTALFPNLNLIPNIIWVLNYKGMRMILLSRLHQITD